MGPALVMIIASVLTSSHAQLSWVPYPGGIPSDSVVATVNNLGTQYVCRGNITQSICPGTFLSGKVSAADYPKLCQIPACHRTFFLDKFDILVSEGGHSWIRNVGYVPAGAVNVGTNENEPYGFNYVCRVPNGESGAYGGAGRVSHNDHPSQCQLPSDVAYFFGTFDYLTVPWNSCPSTPAIGVPTVTTTTVTTTTGTTFTTLTTSTSSTTSSTTLTNSVTPTLTTSTSTVPPDTVTTSTTVLVTTTTTIPTVTTATETVTTTIQSPTTVTTLCWTP